MMPRRAVLRQVPVSSRKRRFPAPLGALALCMLVLCTASARADTSYVSGTRGTGFFPLSAGGRSAPLCASSHDYPGVRRVLGQLRADIGRVTGAEPTVLVDTVPPAGEIVLVGTLGNSPLIDRLVREKKLSPDGIAGKRETFLLQAVDKPLPGIDRALVIAGSDKRGTIYGMYDLAAQIGVSPWYWWADVPPRKSAELYIRPGRHTQGEPKVEYRGIFINDEAPALSGWVEKTFGGFNARFYDHVFELILRLKGNFLWPAMWGRAFYDDDPENPRLADEYGVVIGTSHHEPMMRAHDEWRRYGRGGAWNYEKNDSALRAFWREGIRRMGSYESIVTLAMRGDGDEPMSADANVALLERIVSDQRRILGEVTGRDITTIPQVWALYKEVQEYYDRGMRVPDDVTVLLCDDNWGNLRRLPKPSDPPHPGGYGIYYHFDYVGGPRNYKWVNTTQIERVWEQMHRAYTSGVRRIWVVNVGDIKPMELPISFFLDYAWDPDAISAADLPGYYRRWAAEQFGPRLAAKIADILMQYTKFNARRKPELLDSTTYSLTNYREAETVVKEYNACAGRARSLYDSLPQESRDAYYELVLHQPAACAVLNELHVTAGRNHLYAAQGRAGTEALARRVEELFARDAEITSYYNNVVAGGKWSHMMDQTHIGYTGWQQPDSNAMPPVSTISLAQGAQMGVAVEGSTAWWPHDGADAVLPECDRYNRQSTYIEIFNRGKAPFRYSVRPAEPWVRVDSAAGTITTEKRIWVSIDWTAAPPGRHRVPITVSGAGRRSVTVTAAVNNPSDPRPEAMEGFVESDGCVAMEAHHYARAVNTPQGRWLEIPNLGRTGSAMTALSATTRRQTAEGEPPRLDYVLQLFTAGEVAVEAYFSPVLDCFGGQGVRYAVAFDDEPMQIVNITATDTVPDWKYPGWWNETVSNNIRIVTSHHVLRTDGRHVLRFWAIDPGVVLQRLVVVTGAVRASYLGPPESFHR